MSEGENTRQTRILEYRRRNLILILGAVAFVAGVVIGGFMVASDHDHTKLEWGMPAVCFAFSCVALFPERVEALWDRYWSKKA